MKKNPDTGLLILRIAIGGLMLLHGIAKLKGISFIEGMLVSKGLPSLLAYGVYLTEIVAPVLLIVGYRTRLSALLYISGTIFAMLLVHSADIFTLTSNGGWGVELLGLYTFGALTLFFTGGGKLALSTSNQWD